MCLVTGSSPANPVPAPIAPSPTLASVTASAANTTKDAVDAISNNAAIIGKRQGVFGNIKTQPFGDATYGKYTVAKFGSSTPLKIAA